MITYTELQEALHDFLAGESKPDVSEGMPKVGCLKFENRHFDESLVKSSDDLMMQLEDVRLGNSFCRALEVGKDAELMLLSAYRKKWLTVEDDAHTLAFVGRRMDLSDVWVKAHKQDKTKCEVQGNLICNSADKGVIYAEQHVLGVNKGVKNSNANEVRVDISRT